MEIDAVDLAYFEPALPYSEPVMSKKLRAVAIDTWAGRSIREAAPSLAGDSVSIHLTLVSRFLAS
jgi:hypothetical protein